MSAPEPTRQLRCDARRNRERVIEAGREALAEYGLNAQMDDIARRAGVGVGTVYRHFPTKDVLVGELLRRKLARLAALAGGPRGRGRAMPGSPLPRCCARRRSSRDRTPRCSA